MQHICVNCGAYLYQNIGLMQRNGKILIPCALCPAQIAYKYSEFCCNSVGTTLSDSPKCLCEKCAFPLMSTETPFSRLKKPMHVLVLLHWAQQCISHLLCGNKCLLFSFTRKSCGCRSLGAPGKVIALIPLCSLEMDGSLHTHCAEEWL